jgi:site-specific DNA recombinase
LLADKAITQDDYLEIIEDNNNELAQLVKKKNEMLSVLESEEVINNLDKLKQDFFIF